LYFDSVWKEKSISRCSLTSLKTAQMYALMDMSLGEDNIVQCSHITDNSVLLELYMVDNCDSENNDAMLQMMVKQVIQEVNNKCLCGLTTLHVVGKSQLG